MTTTLSPDASRPEPVQTGVRWGLSLDVPLPRPRGTRLVAIASSRGERVDRVFEEVGDFYLYEISSQAIRFIGRQSCSPSSPRTTPADTVRRLRDCDLVLCAGIGARCRRMLDQLGVDCSLTCAGKLLEQAVVTAGRMAHDA